MTPSENPPEDIEVNSREALVSGILRVKETSGVKALQKKFNGFDEQKKRELLRADEQSVLQKVIDTFSFDTPLEHVIKMPKEFIKNATFFAATYGLIDVDEKMLEQSRGMPGSIVYKIPDIIAKQVFTLIGAPEIYPIWKIGKAINSANENIASEIRKQVRAQSHTKTSPANHGPEKLAA